MTYRAKMENGQVVFQGGVKPSDGVELRVEVVPKPRTREGTEPEKPADSATPSKPTLSDVLTRFAGIMDDPSLPEDGSINHDHYIYGSPKR